MTSKQKSKGNSWENEVCKKLTEIFGGSFIRSMGSGSYIGGTNVHRKSTLSQTQIMATKGDIHPASHMPKFNIECKSYKDIAFHQIISGECAQLNKWIDQMLEPSDEGDFDLLAFKITRRGTFAVVALEHRLVAQSFVVYHYNGVDYQIVDFETLISNNKDAILEKCK